MRTHTELLLALLVVVAQPRPGRCQEHNTWEVLPRIPSGTLQENSAVAVSAAQIAVVGGLVPDNSSTSMVQLYDVAAGTWRNATRMPVGLNHPNAAADGGRVFVLSGLVSTGNHTGQFWQATPACSVYDPAADSWAAVEPLPAPEARGAAAVGVYEGVVYLAGGIPGAPAGDSVDTVSAFDTAAGRWLALPPAARRLPAPRDHVGGAVVGHRFYVVGGRDSGVTNLRDTVFVLDLRDVAAGWTAAAGRMPTPRASIATGAVGTKIYTFGGEGNRAPGNSDGVFDQAEVYDTVSDSWARLPPMKRPRHGTQAAVAGGKIYIPGGAIHEGVGGTDYFDAFVP